MIRDEGERPMYGSLVDVEIRVKVQRYFFYDTVHTGTVTVVMWASASLRLVKRR